MADRAQKGHVLKKAREAKGITLEAVQDATKIPLDSLKAIEEGYRVRTLTDFYYKAFVKLYARYLGIDVKTVLENYKEEKVPPPTKFRKVKNFLHEKETPPFFQKEIVKLALKGLAGIVVLVVVASLLFALGRWIKSRPTQPRKAAVKVQKVVAKKETVKPKSSEEKKTSGSEAASATKERLKKLNLTIRAKKSTWVSVRVDGIDRLRTTLAKGAVEAWNAKDKIEISGRNLTDLEFELNGQPTNPAGKTSRSIKKIILTQDGFKILN